ncbi:MAG: alkaline phosphatase family protein [Candidatus Helarchaeota archaeon]
MNINHVILLIIDDFRYDHFISLLKENKLPNLGKLKNNAIWGKSITTFPSVTIPAHLTIMTGLYQDSYNIPLMQWYDRIQKKIKNYSVGLQAFEIYEDIGDIETIFEKINGATCNIFEPIHRGALYNYPGKLKAIGKYLYYKYISDLNKTNEIITNRILKIFKNPRKFFPNSQGSPPIFCAGWFLATDMILHTFGVDSKEYLASLQSVDKAIGKLITGLKELNYLDSTAIIVVSDHGNYTAKELYNPQLDFKRYNLFPLQPKKGKGDYDIADGSILALYLSGDNDKTFKTESKLRNYKNKIDVIEVIKNLKGVKWIAFRSDNISNTKGTYIFLRKIREKWKKAYFHYNDMKVRYEPEKLDLLGYDKSKENHKWLDYEKYYTLDEWLKYTHDLDFPMFPDQIHRNFMNKNSCDIFISSMAEIVYNSVHGKVKNNYHIYAHDVALSCSMQVPLLIYNPNLKEKQIPFSKTSDLVPTILKLLNYKIDPKLPGIDLINKKYN